MPRSKRGCPKVASLQGYAHVGEGTDLCIRSVYWVDYHYYSSIGYFRDVNIKGRKFVCIALITLWGFTTLSSQTSGSSESRLIQTTSDTTQGFEDPELAIDSMVIWLFNRRSTYNNHGLLSETNFHDLTRMTDTVINDQNIHGNWLQYQYRFKKSLKKSIKYGKKNGIRSNRLNIPRSKIIRYDRNGATPTSRLEIPLESRKDRFILRLDFFKWKNQWYFTGKVRIYKN